MPKSKTKTTVEYDVKEFNKIIASLPEFRGRNISVQYVVIEVGDPLDRYRGHPECVSIRISYEGEPEQPKSTLTTTNSSLGHQIASVEQNCNGPYS